MVFINSNSEDETIGSIYSHIFFLYTLEVQKTHETNGPHGPQFFDDQSSLLQKIVFGEKGIVSIGRSLPHPKINGSTEPGIFCGCFVFFYGIN